MLCWFHEEMGLSYLDWERPIILVPPDWMMPTPRRESDIFPKDMGESFALDEKGASAGHLGNSLKRS
jgi:hypothetical protein